MNAEIRIKQNIENALKNFHQHPLRDGAIALLNTLGYQSQRTGNDGIDHERFKRLQAAAKETATLAQKLRIHDWHGFHLLCQLTDTEINAHIRGQGEIFGNPIAENVMNSYIFAALELKGTTYTRTHLADITRFINRHLPQPLLVLFRYADTLTLAIINRRWSQHHHKKHVLEKVTLIKDINLSTPHRAHVDILSELHLNSLIESEGVHNFDTLHKAWEGILNTESLNKRFYRDLEGWYEWAVETCRFPDAKNEMQVIRLITRLLFIWFLKEKGLVPSELLVAQSRNTPPHFC